MAEMIPMVRRRSKVSPTSAVGRTLKRLFERDEVPYTAQRYVVLEAIRGRALIPQALIHGHCVGPFAPRERTLNDMLRVLDHMDLVERFEANGTAYYRLSAKGRRWLLRFEEQHWSDVSRYWDRRRGKAR